MYNEKEIEAAYESLYQLYLQTQWTQGSEAITLRLKSMTAENRKHIAHHYGIPCSIRRIAARVNESYEIRK